MIDNLNASFECVIERFHPNLPAPAENKPTPMLSEALRTVKIRLFEFLNYTLRPVLRPFQAVARRRFSRRLGPGDRTQSSLAR